MLTYCQQFAVENRSFSSSETHWNSSLNQLSSIIANRKARILLYQVDLPSTNKSNVHHPPPLAKKPCAPFCHHLNPWNLPRPRLFTQLSEWPSDPHRSNHYFKVPAINPSQQTCTPTSALLRQLLLPHQILLPMLHDFILLNLCCYNTATTENLLPLLSPSFYISTSLSTDHPASRHATRRFGNSMPGTWVCNNSHARMFMAGIAKIPGRAQQSTLFIFSSLGGLYCLELRSNTVKNAIDNALKRTWFENLWLKVLALKSW